METITVNEKSYSVKVGPKGGKYYIDENGKKKYIKSAKNIVNMPPSKVAKKGTILKEYIADITDLDTNEVITESFCAYTKEAAELHFSSAHPNAAVTIKDWKLA